VPFYQRAYQYCQLGIYRDKSPVLTEAKPISRKVVETSSFELAEFRFSPPTRFGERFRSRLASSDRIKVYLHANVTNIDVSSSGQFATEVEVQTLTGRKFAVTADIFILCCGAIENARILLNCTRFFPSGIGNEHDIGRFFMDHLEAVGGILIPRDEYFNLDPFLLRGGRDGDVPITLVFKTSSQVIRQKRRAGCSVLFDQQYQKLESSPSFDAVRSLIRDIKNGFPKVQERGCAALDDPESIVRALYYRLTKRFRNRGAIEYITIGLIGEQSPNPGLANCAKRL
jgi:hypothetical protein